MVVQLIAGRQLLSAQELEAYSRDGQVTASHRLPADLLDALTEAIEGLIADNPGIRPEALSGAHVPDNADTGVRGRAELLAHACHPDLLDMVAQILGPDLIVWGSHVFAKPARDGMAVPWHQDGQYWDFIRPLRAVTAWIAIDPSTKENGCLRILPGSHLRGPLAHDIDDNPALALNRGLGRADVDEALARDIEMEPGQVSLHHHMLIHGSTANTSGRRRCGYTIRFMPATSHFDRTIPPTRIAEAQVIDFARRPIWLVRGEDRAGNDFLVGHDAREAPTHLER
jgi:phytanoyl-CoA dioxygenase PhyH